MSAQNGLSNIISIPGGFSFGNSTQTSVYVRIKIIPSIACYAKESQIIDKEKFSLGGGGGGGE